MTDFDPSTWDGKVLRAEWRKMSEEVGAAWDATPDDMVAEHATLADAVAALVRQRDEARADAAIWERHYENLRDAGAAATMAVPANCATIAPPATLTAAEALSLVEGKVERLAGEVGQRLSADTLNDAGYAQLLASSMSVLVGYIDGLRAGLGGSDV